MIISVEDFSAGNIDPAQFDHAAHIEVAWRFLDKYGPDTGSRIFREELIRLSIELGAPGKFHETITRFFLEEIAARMRSNQDWEAFREQNDELFDGREILGRFYSTDTLNSDEARYRYIAPDRAPRAIDGP